MFNEKCKTDADANIRTLQPKAVYFSPYLSSKIER